jgi:hypothetical protein
MTARHLARDTATFTRLRFKRNAIPRGTSPCEEAVIEMKATGASWPWNLSTVPTFTAESPAASSSSRMHATWALPMPRSAPQVACPLGNILNVKRCLEY